MNSSLPQLMGTSLRGENNKKSSLASVTEYSYSRLILRGNLKPRLETCSFGEHFVSYIRTNATDLVARLEKSKVRCTSCSVSLVHWYAKVILCILASRQGIDNWPGPRPEWSFLARGRDWPVQEVYRDILTEFYVDFYKLFNLMTREEPPIFN
jgi:hypothetical protein